MTVSMQEEVGKIMAATEKETKSALFVFNHVWTYFGFFNKEGMKEMDMTNGIYKECRMKIFGNTTNIRAHLSHYYRDIALAEDVKANIKSHLA